MPRPRLRTVTLDEVKITRDGDYAIFRYVDPSMGGGMDLKVGPRVKTMTFDELVELHNDIVRERLALAAHYKHEAIEIVGGPQIEYSEQCCQWVPRGDVLRCIVTWRDGEPAIEIDDTELKLREFGEMLSTHEGWGMRVVFVPEGELQKTPKIKVSTGKRERSDGGTRSGQ
ncbi:MAG: hypothetical protein HY796_00445 [Elusimicrobia bacterium]|nr:hypothetical protein [Elusimicrobiota bacterium]